MRVHIDRIFTTVSRNLGLQDFSRYTDNWIEWAYEAERLIGSRDTFVQKESTYTATGAKASGTITFATNPVSGDSIELNGAQLYFRNTTDIGEGKAQNEIGLSGALPSTLDNQNSPYGLIQELTGYSDIINLTGLLPNSATLNYPEALNIADYNVNSTGGILTITSKEVGFEGNNYTMASDTENSKISGLTLTGGKGIYRNQQIRLPDNMVKFLGVRVSNDDTSGNKDAEIRRTSAIHRGAVSDSSLRYYIEGNRLNIKNNKVGEITIVYLEYPTDLRGWPMIKDNHETAVSQYIMWQHKLIEYYNGKLPQYIIKDIEKRWYFLCGQVRGEDEMPTSEELKQIGRMWNTLVPLKSNRGLIDF